MTLRTLTWILSLALHSTIALAFMIPGGSNSALDEGAGDDQLVVEQGISIEGFAKTGDDVTTVEAVEAPPVLSEARPEIKEVKPVEEEQDKIVTSENGPEQEEIVKEPEKVEEAPKPPQVATLEQKEVAVEEQRAAGAKKSGGDVTEMSAYRGKLFAHLASKKVNPRSRLTGTVLVRFTVDAKGELVSKEVAESSGSKVLDDAAVASLERASPFPPMPDGMSADPMTMTVPFKYRVK
jgi:protein TonB